MTGILLQRGELHRGMHAPPSELCLGGILLIDGQWYSLMVFISPRPLTASESQSDSPPGRWLWSCAKATAAVAAAGYWSSKLRGAVMVPASLP